MKIVVFTDLHYRTDGAVNGGVKVCHWGGAKVGQFV